MTAAISETRLAEAREKLEAWLDDIQIGRYERPQFANPGELKDALRQILAALTAAEAKAERAEAAWQEAEHPFDKAEYDAMFARAVAAEADAKQYREALERIGEWDCLSPPVDALADLPWLRRVVDEALGRA